MDLILWRHAEAEDAPEGGDDLARALTGKGERQAEWIGKWLDQRLPENALILVSPAKRTQQTAQALGRKYTSVESIAPGAAADAVLAAARWPQSDRPVVVVGHQPTLGFVAGRLLGTPAQSLHMRKGALWWMRQRKRDGDEEIVVVAVVSAELL